VTPARFPPVGATIDFVNTKWGDRPHWEFVVTYLGEDEHGHWLGLPPGTHFRRPGMEFTSTNTQVTLLPHDAWWVATFHGADGPPREGWANLGGDPVEMYADMTSPAELDATSVRCVDLDLDVVRGTGGVVMVDDEDEFAEHQGLYGYPAEVVAAVEAACADVRRLAEQQIAPFDGLAPRVWLDRVRAP
jgi:predicted RNA-binding protein associated with RNAse of E/G family